MMKNKWLGIIFVVMLLAAIVSVVYYWQVASLPVPYFEVPRHDQTTKLQTYSNEQFGFEVKYDKAYALSTSKDQENYFRTNGKTLASISIPQSFFPGTNFGSASVTFAVRENTSYDECNYYSLDGKTSIPLIIGDTQDAFVTEFDGAAAGTHYKTKLAHIPLTDNSICYELNQTIGIANIGNYEPGAVKEVDESLVWNKLSEILSTFKFRDVVSKDTSSWKTYTNTQYGFEFKYPIDPDVEIKNSQTPDTVGFLWTAGIDTSEGGYLMSLGLLNKANYSLYKSEKGQLIIIGGKNAYKFDDCGRGGCQSTYVIDLENNIKLSFSGAFCSGEDGWDTCKKDPKGSLYEEGFLTTFKFTDTVTCGGFGGLPCPTSGYRCQVEGNYPDAATICKKIN